MDHFGRRTNLARRVARTSVLSREPFVLIDVGCSGGIDDEWRVFEPNLIGVGFDPNASECARLQKLEQNARIRYVAGYVGLPDENALVRAIGGRFWVNSPWERLSAAAAADNRRRIRGYIPPEQVAPGDEYAESDAIVVLPDYCAQHGLERVDFVKIDTDGPDLLVLSSLEGVFDKLSVLGLTIEVNFFGGEDGSNNTFHNVDRLMRGAGFELFDLSTRRYSTTALPAPFRSHVPGPTLFGRVVQGDAFYARDLGSRATRSTREWTAAEVLKLASLFDLYGLPDCAAEVLVEFREMLADHLDVGPLLDALVPTVRGKRWRYDEYLARFAGDDRRFYRLSGARRVAAKLSPALRNRLLTNRQVSALRGRLDR